METIQSLREKVWELEEEVRMLKAEMFGDEIIVPVEWMLTGRERALITTMAKRPMMTKEQGLAAITYANGDAPEIKIIDVFICKMRKKLTPHGVNIITHWGAGYSLDDATRKMLQGNRNEIANAATQI